MGRKPKTTRSPKQLFEQDHDQAQLAWVQAFDAWAARVAETPPSEFGIRSLARSTAEDSRASGSPTSLDYAWEFAGICRAFVCTDIFAQGQRLLGEGVPVDSLEPLLVKHSARVLLDTSRSKWLAGRGILEREWSYWGEPGSYEAVWTAAVIELVADYIEVVIKRWSTPASRGNFLEEVAKASRASAAKANRRSVQDFVNRFDRATGRRLKQKDLATILGYASISEIKRYMSGKLPLHGTAANATLTSTCRPRTVSTSSLVRSTTSTPRRSSRIPIISRIPHSSNGSKRAV